MDVHQLGIGGEFVRLRPADRKPSSAGPRSRLGRRLVANAIGENVGPGAGLLDEQAPARSSVTVAAMLSTATRRVAHWPAVLGVAAAAAMVLVSIAGCSRQARRTAIRCDCVGASTSYAGYARVWVIRKGGHGSFCRFRVSVSNS